MLMNNHHLVYVQPLIDSLGFFKCKYELEFTQDLFSYCTADVGASRHLSNACKYLAFASFPLPVKINAIVNANDTLANYQ
jgi:hypothetical protein